MAPIKAFSEQRSPLVLPPLYARSRARLLCRRCLGFNLLFLFTAFFSLFLLGFGQVASPRVLEQWLQSSEA